MKQILPFMAVVFFIFGCAPPKKASKTNASEKKIQILNNAPIEKQFDVGTCSIIIKNSKIIKETNSFWLTGKVEKIKGYGSSFPEVINVDQLVKVKVNQKQAKQLEKLDKVNCSIKAIENMNDSSFFELVKIK